MLISYVQNALLHYLSILEKRKLAKQHRVDKLLEEGQNLLAESINNKKSKNGMLLSSIHSISHSSIPLLHP